MNGSKMRSKMKKKDSLKQMKRRTTTQNPCDTGKAVGIQRDIHRLQAYLKKQENAQINNITSHLNELEKEQKKTKTKVSRRKEIIKMRAEINKIDS